MRGSTEKVNTLYIVEEALVLSCAVFSLVYGKKPIKLIHQQKKKPSGKLPISRKIGHQFFFNLVSYLKN